MRVLGQAGRDAILAAVCGVLKSMSDRRKEQGLTK